MKSVRAYLIGSIHKQNGVLTHIDLFSERSPTQSFKYFCFVVMEAQPTETYEEGIKDLRDLFQGPQRRLPWMWTLNYMSLRTLEALGLR